MGTFRDDEVGADRRRGPLLAQACGMGEVIALTGLATGEVEQLIGSMTGTTAGGLAADVFGRSGGNPFFVREVTQLLLSRGALEENAAVGGIPDGVRQVVAQRLARLPQASVTILTVAAVAGRDTSGDLLARVSGADIEQVAQRLDGAVRARMLVPPLGPAGPYRFTHDLFRETLYEGLTPSARAGLHLRVARALQVSQSNGSVVHPAELAHHLLLATIGQPGAPGSLADEAVRYGVLAAREAVARLAYEDAVGHVQRQLDGLAPAGLLRESIRLELVLCRADALRRAGDIAAAREDYRQALELARHSPRPSDLAEVALGVHALGVESGTSRAACIDLLDEALDRLGDGGTALTARVLAALARELFLSDKTQRGRATTLCAAAVETARRVHDDATLAVALLACHDTLWQPGTAQRRRAVAAEMAEVARRAGDREFEAEACLLRGLVLLELGEPAALSELDDFVRLCATNDEGAVDVDICGFGFNAVQVMEVGPPESPCRGRFQTTVCCAG